MNKLSAIIKVMVKGDHKFIIWDIINIGGNFWIVKIVKVSGQVMFEITGGIQKWAGAAPIFIRMVIKKIKLINDKFWNVYISEIDIRKADELILWIRKYLIAASVLEFNGETSIRGRIANMLISILIHIVIQLEEDNAIIIDIIMTTLNKAVFGWGLVNIIGRSEESISL